MKKDLFNNTYLSSLCLELYLVMQAGISVNEGFLLVAEDEMDERCKEILQGIFEKLETGEELTLAIEESGAFPKYMVDMVGIGERTGSLESVFKGLSGYYDRQEAISAGIRNAVVYPVVLFIMMITVIAVLIIEVLPIFNDVFAQLGASMSPMALTFMNFGIALSNGKWIVLGIIALLIIAAIVIAAVPAAREGFAAWWTRVIAKTKLGLKIATARFASAMAMCMAGTLDVDSSLEMAERLNQGSAISPKIAKCRELIGEGQGFFEAIVSVELFHPIHCRMLSIGIKTGAADSVMEEIARRTQEDVDAAIEKTIGRVEPVLVVIMSVMVGLVLLSVMLPLMGVMSSIG